MKLEELEGRWESASSLGPGIQYTLELHGKRAGRKAGEHFSLTAAHWTSRGRLVPGTSRPRVDLLFTRAYQGAWRLDGATLALEAREAADLPGPDAGVPPEPTMRRAVSQTFQAIVTPGTAPVLTLGIDGTQTPLSRVR